MENLREKVEEACKQYGAYRVRKAAIKQMTGDNEALEDVNLNSYVSEYNDLLRISHMAFDAMSLQDKMRENLYNINFSEKDVEEFIARINFDKLDKLDI